MLTNSKKMNNSKKICFYCPEKIFKPGGGATVAKNILENYVNGERNMIILSKNTNVSAEIKEKYDVVKINYPTNSFLRVFYDLIIAPIILIYYRKYKVICLNSIVPLLYPLEIDVFFQMRMFHFQEFDTFSKKIKNFLGKMSIKKAKNIYVASKDHKKDIVSNVKVAPDKVKVAYLGFDFSYCLDELYAESLNKEPYWLFISIFRPYKNLETLLISYSILVEECHRVPKLILIGDFPAGYSGIEDYKSNINKIMIDNNLSKKVEFKGIKSHKKSMKYLRNASLFIFPSKFEGFGLPILEAMALEVPVLSSNAHSLPEIGGDEIMYFDPNSKEDLVQKLKKILNEGYSKDTAKAKLRSKYFTWNNTCSVIYKSNIE